jgi:ATP-dependent DNA ligase
MKMDGMRFNAIVREGKVEFRSRNGKEILLLGNLEKEFAALAGKIDCVFDGELLVMDEFDYQFMDRQSGNGILNKANKGTISAKEASMVHASLWDLIPYEEFISGRCVTPYAKRFSSLEIVVSKQKPQDKKIWLVSSEIVQNIEEAQSIFQNYLSLGHEGIILKDGSGVWEDKRVKTQIKFKAELDCDLRIIDIQPGTGKYTGMVGAYICESEDGIVKVDVGSGLTDEERTNFDVIGKIATVLYNARIKNKQGEESLFLPRLVEIREDKDKADSSKKIK